MSGGTNAAVAEIFSR